MSYDLRFAVKIDGTDIFAQVGTPEYDTPTYNLGEMFRVCTGWDFEQGTFYKCSDVMPLIERGIRELEENPKKYKKYNPPNGWGDLEGALRVLRSLREGIYELAENVPIEHLYVAW